MDAGADFVREIAKGAEVQTFQIDGKTFATSPLHEINVDKLPQQLPLAPLVSVVTLAGFVDLIRNGLESLAVTSGDVLIHVVNETTVALIAKKADEHGRRNKLIEAKPVPFQGFTFNQFHAQEDFLIGFASKFVPGTGDFDYIVDVVSSLTVGAERKAEDDGLAQKVTTQRGMRLKGELQIRPRVNLAPFRTFPEVTQPVSQFLLRLKGGSDTQAPTVALFEADGGKWKNDAINEIRRHLSALSDVEIPVIA